MIVPCFAVSLVEFGMVRLSRHAAGRAHDRGRSIFSARPSTNARILVLASVFPAATENMRLSKCEPVAGSALAARGRASITAKLLAGHFQRRAPLNPMPLN